jgi:hypothetical protein
LAHHDSYAGITPTNGITVADLNTLDKIIFLLDGGKLLQTGKVASIRPNTSIAVTRCKVDGTKI